MGLEEHPRLPLISSKLLLLVGLKRWPVVLLARSLMPSLLAGFGKQELAKVLSRSTMALSCSWGGKLQPVLAALEGVLGSRQAVMAAVSKAPELLGMALTTIDDNLSVLHAAGLSPDGVRRSISKQPQLFYRAYASPEFQAKLRYFDEVLGMAPRLMFLEFPSSLMFGLHRIDYRVSNLPITC